MSAVVCHEQEQGAYDAHDGALRQPVGAEHFLEMLQLRAGGKHGAHIAVLLLGRIAKRQNPAPLYRVYSTSPIDKRRLARTSWKNLRSST